MHRLIPSVVLAVSVIMSIPIFGQEDTTTAKPSPYDLISNYYSDDFNPFEKSTKYLGLAFSLQDRSLENTPRLLETVVDGSQLDFDIEVKGGYFIGDYVMAGVNIQYAYDRFEGIVVRDGDTIRSENVSKRLTAIPVIKPYFPVTKNERLSFFTEIGVGFGGGNGLSRETKNEDEVTKSVSSEFVFSIGFTPGITFFAIENFAFEVGVNVIGYTLQREEVTFNEVETSVETKHNVNLDINLLSLQLGIAYYL